MALARAIGWRQEPTTAREEQLANLRRERANWARGQVYYSFLNVLFRLYVLVVPAVVAAKEALSTAPLLEIAYLVPALMLGVTIASLIDGALKPKHRWAIFLRDHADIDVLTANALLLRPEDEAGLRKSIADLRALEESHLADITG